MNKFKQKINPFLASSLLAITIVSAPLITLANDNKGNENREVKTEKLANADNSKKVNSNSFFGKVFGGFNFFGNSINAKAVAQINPNLAPNISGVKAPTVLKVGETGTWTVKASDPQNGSLNYSVDWGDAKMQIFAKIAPVFVQSSTFEHAYANPGNYKITFTVENDAGLKNTSTTTVHVIGSAVQQAPVISNPGAVSDKPHQAVLKWTTDVRATSLVWYSKTSPVDTSLKANVSRSAKIKNHKIVLSKLDPGTTYYVILGSANRAGKTMSSEISFTTPSLPGDKTPVITSLEGPTAVVAGEEETITVNAYDPKNDSLSYSADWGDNAPSMMSKLTPEPPFVQTTTFSHIYASAGTYTAVFTAENSAGLKTSSSITITVTENPTDTTKPLISNVNSNASASLSTITWNTDEAATSKVFYSSSSPVDLSSSDSVSDTSLTTNHSLNISGLTPSTLYYYVVESLDASNNQSVSSEFSFTTGSGS